MEKLIEMLEGKIKVLQETPIFAQGSQYERQGELRAYKSVLEFIKLEIKPRIHNKPAISSIKQYEAGRGSMFIC